MFDPTHWTINWLPNKSKTYDIAATTKFPLKMGLIEYPKEKIADVNQASFQSFFIVKMPLACVSDYDSQALNFASVDQEWTAFDKVKRKLFRR